MNLVKLQSADVFHRLLVVVQVFQLSLEIRVVLLVLVGEVDGMFVVPR